jgi:hypothetical protein
MGRDIHDSIRQLLGKHIKVRQSKRIRPDFLIAKLHPIHEIEMSYDIHLLFLYEYMSKVSNPKMNANEWLSTLVTSLRYLSLIHKTMENPTFFPYFFPIWPTTLDVIRIG